MTVGVKCAEQHFFKTRQEDQESFVAKNIEDCGGNGIRRKSKRQRRLSTVSYASNAEKYSYHTEIRIVFIVDESAILGIDSY